jgi:hypothetical protein
MQLLFRAILALYLGHLLADFVFQSSRLVERKRRGKFSAYALHGLIHFLSLAAIAGFVLPGSLFASRTCAVIAALTIVHLLIDLGKMRLAARYSLCDGARAYVADQVLHFATVVFAAWLLPPAVPFRELTTLVQDARAIPNRFLVVPVIYAAVIFGGGYLIRSLVGALAAGVKTHSPEKTNEQLQNAGLYIGWLERFLVVTALLVQSPATVGLILTAKSIARYPEFKSEHFAEYFLIGTLLSISMAVIGGALLAKLVFGQIHVPG